MLLQLTGFSSHVSYFTDRGTGVRRSGRLPITSFANVSFPNASNGALGHALRRFPRSPILSVFQARVCVL